MSEEPESQWKPCCRFPEFGALLVASANERSPWWRHPPSSVAFKAVFQLSQKREKTKKKKEKKMENNENVLKRRLGDETTPEKKRKIDAEG